MHEEGTVVGVANILQDRHELSQIVSVDDAEVIETELFEQCAAGDKPASELFSEVRLFFEELRKVARNLSADITYRHVSRARQQPRKIIRHGTDRWCNGHLVVVQY